MPNNVSRLMALAACSFLWCGSVWGQDLTPTKFASVKRLQCVFSAAAAGVWPDGAAAVRPRATVVLKLEIDAIDAQDGSAVMRGAPESSAHLVAQFSGWTLHLLQTDVTGGLAVTSVFARESRDGKLKATYSRANFLPAGAPGVVTEPEAQQYYGECDTAYYP